MITPNEFQRRSRTRSVIEWALTCKKITVYLLSMNSRAEYYRASMHSPEWISFSNDIKARDDFRCSDCGTRQPPLHSHHKYYVDGRLAWEYPLSALETVCANCHAERHLKRIPRYSEGSLELLEIENYPLFLREKQRIASLEKEIQSKRQAEAEFKSQKRREQGEFFQSLFNKIIIYIFASSLVIMLLYNYFPPSNNEGNSNNNDSHFYSYWFVSLVIVFVLRRIYKFVYRFAKSEIELWRDDK